METTVIARTVVKYHYTQEMQVETEKPLKYIILLERPLRAGSGAPLEVAGYQVNQNSEPSNAMT